jgi:hypothetical protein
MMHIPAGHTEAVLVVGPGLLLLLLLLLQSHQQSKKCLMPFTPDGTG